MREEIAQGESDLGQLVVLADDVAAYADSLAARFAAIDRQIVGLAEVKPGSSPGEKPPSQRRKTKRQSGRGGQRRRSSTLRRTEEPTVTELLEQAKEAAIPGRSSMSKDELAEAVEAQEQQTKDELLDRFWPDAARYLGTAERGVSGAAKLHFPGLHPDAAKWLVDKRIASVGIDTASIDYGASTHFESHLTLMTAGIPAFENLTRLDALPPKGAFVVALPVKIKGGSGGPLVVEDVLTVVQVQHRVALRRRAAVARRQVDRHRPLVAQQCRGEALVDAPCAAHSVAFSAGGSTAW